MWISPCTDSPRSSIWTGELHPEFLKSVENGTVNFKDSLTLEITTKDGCVYNLTPEWMHYSFANYEEIQNNPNCPKFEEE